MGIRKVRKPNVKASAAATEIKRLFIDVPKDTTIQVRPLPLMVADNEDAILYTRAENHFKMKTEDGKGLALACLAVHGTDETGDECYLCKLSKVLVKYGDKLEKEIGKQINASPGFYLQVLRAEETGRDENDKPIFAYTGPYLLRLPKTGADAVTTIMANMDSAGDSDFTDPDEGQDLYITRHSKTPWYSAERSGKSKKLDDIFPDWEKKIIEDVYGELGLKVVTYEEQKQIAMRTFGDRLDWEALADRFGL